MTWLAGLALALVCACQRDRPSGAAPGRVQTVDVSDPAVPLPVAPTAADLFARATVAGSEPPAELPLADLLRRLRIEARQPGLGRLAEFATPSALKTLRMGEGGPLLVPPSTVWDRVDPEVMQVEFSGGRAAVVVRHPGLPLTSWFYLRQGRWLWDLADARELQPHWPGPAHPLNRDLSLDQALAGVAGAGLPELVFETTAGTFVCTLRADLVPDLAAHLVGLATGRRASRVIVGNRFTLDWHHVPLYDGQLIYKPVAAKRIESGDPFGHGTGHAGFRVRDRFDLRLRHDRPGVLSLVSLGPHSCSSMWQVLLRPAPELDDKAPVAGLCRDLPVVDAISRMPQNAVRIVRARVQRANK
ncbi:MAG: peptidylprolyl isomerase [Deltaproteobacteria bacterium]|nr:peptidylprolyl isomerase [Deltaproteobacteria bacterium]